MRFLMLSAFLLAIGCTTSSTTPNDDRQGPGETQNKTDAVQRQRLLEIAAGYKKYEKVDGKMRVAPALCAPALPPVLDYRLSRSEDESTHGKKLYTLYAAKIDPFTRDYAEETLAGKKRPLTDQIIVKESWLAVEPGKDDGPFESIKAPDGKRYKAGAKGPLFVMYQTDPKDPNSDEGWVYGTLTPDGKTVTGVGRMENCMNCHKKAPQGRLFGLPKE